jgi:acyl carrier protein
MSLSFEQIFERITALVAEKLTIDRSTITLESTMQDLGADSLDMVEIIMQIEEEFSIEINDADAENLHTMRDVVHYIQGRLNK